jgi:hypothetical protein
LEIFYSLKEARLVIEKCRVDYNTEEAAQWLGYLPPTP